MSARRTSIHGEWSSRFAFILAATGSAVGLGNIWRFPYVTGESGGGAFVLVYLLCVALIGIPVMMAEILLGRRGRQSPLNTMRTLAQEEGRSPAWQYVGWLGMAAGFMILSFYSVVAGWTLAYVVRTATGVFEGATAEGVQSIFTDFIANPEGLLAWHTIFMVMTIIVVSRGVKSGLEQAVRFLMPALFVLLIAMVGYAMNTGQFQQAVEYLFKPDFSRLDAEVVLNAMGQAFFSLSLGMGAIMIYGSYLSHTASITRTAVVVAGMDTLVAILAGLAIFPLVFEYGLEPAGGPGLIFMTLPIAFGQMPGGALFGALFFLLLVFAAWTSAISLLEPAVTWLVENRGMNRVKAAAWSGLAAWVFGILSLLSLNLWSDDRYKLFGMPFIDLVDWLTANVMLPIGGLLIAIFAAWMMSREASRAELGLADGLGFGLWRFLVRYVTPFAILLIFLNKIGVL
ncbi:sodium-dependent transporter [Thiohalobacter sp. IOR34]|uniref:sodium-dependent transporter n=1 Tax=Thiohalobacter sp. IOR34 TaxID=3057176 RepID=UPI0025B197FF|nr:sodium-dependent transporter [Thiohalobacter sp. IOR34]WJW76448.1 sodium-dependent transporter [Thiohalobacter sp. IOR34]